MDSLWIEGGRRLEGQLEVPASKNAALPLLCLTLLTNEPLQFRNLPHLKDIEVMKSLLQELGVEEIEPGTFQCRQIQASCAPYELVRRMRASIMVLGPLLARTGYAEVSLPGGCAIGQRPVDIHLKGLKEMGADIFLEAGYVRAKANGLKACRFVLDYPTVTGTMNLIMAAVFADGESVFENVAREPEITELVQALNQMGAKIEGAGEARLVIQGVNQLKGMEWTIQPDRIQTLTYLAAAAITGGSLRCRPYRAGSLNAVLQKFMEMGCEIREADNELILAQAPERFSPVHIDTAPFPGFPTDAQAQFMACLSVAQPGASTIVENVFENRFGHVSELRRMGAQIEVKGKTAMVHGQEKLSGAQVMASDLRASASMVLAGLRAEGKTEVLRIYHLDRGYERLEDQLRTLGAKIWREKVA